MKLKQIFIAVVFLFLGFTTKVTAQQVGFTYQAVAIDESKAQGFGRDSRGEILVNKGISLRFSIREATEEGEIKYQEIHHATTDIFGIFRLVIGRGLNATGTPLADLHWGEIAYFLQVEIDPGKGFEFMGVEELLGVPYALNTSKQLLNLNQNELSISNGNSVILNDNDPTNELITGFNIEGTNLQITDAGGTRSLDLKDLAGGTLNEAEVDVFVSNNGYLTNEIQDLQLNGHILSITNIHGGTEIDLSTYLDDTNLTESEVDAFVSNNGYLTNEIDGSVTNEIQNLTLNNHLLTITNNVSATPVDLTSYRNIFERTNSIISNENGDYTTDDFVFGSPQLNNDGNSAHANRMFFDKSKSAFRAGSDLTEWNDVNIGFNSIGLGYRTQASGLNSIVAGENSVASGQNSTSIGTNNNVSGAFGSATGRQNNVSGQNSHALGFGNIIPANQSVSIGYDNNLSSPIPNNAVGGYAFGESHIVSGLGGVAIGIDNNALNTYTSSFGNSSGALGQYSMTLGYNVTAFSYGETAMGLFSTNYVGYDANNSIDTNRLLVIGNGANPGLRSDALVILKNGNTTLNGQLTIDADNVSGVGGSYTFPGQRGTNGQVMSTNGSGVLSWTTLPLSAFSTNAGVTSNSPGNFTSDDFVFGSPQLADDGVTTHDSRMSFDKSKGAFRAGQVTGTRWDDANVGTYSVAFGSDCQAGDNAFAAGSNAIAGWVSFAFGIQTNASGSNSIAMGSSADATGVSAVSIGNLTTASGQCSTAFGNSSTASGNNSSSVGRGTLARSYGEFATGLFNTDYIPTNSLDYSSQDRLFVIGNGAISAARSDALVILKDGSTRLHGLLTIDADNTYGPSGSYTFPGQRGTNGQVMVTNGSGVLNWSTLAVSAFTTTTGVTSNEPGTYATDDFVFGSPQLDDDGDGDHDSRFFFDKSKAAFRAGATDGGGQWGDMNVGVNSIAMGNSPIAQGSGSIALGYASQALGSDAIAIGSNCGALETESLAIGIDAFAYAERSVAIGSLLSASGDAAFALGYGLEASSFHETAMGMFGTIIPGTAGSFNSTDRLFFIGNGMDDFNRSDAFTIFKSGDATLAGTLTQNSDSRLKRNVIPLNNSLTKITTLNGIHYKWNNVKPKDTTSLQTGFIAQEVEKILPELVQTDSEGFKSVNYIGLIPHLVEAIKELRVENERLRTENEKVKSDSNTKLHAIEARLSQLEKMIEGNKTNKSTVKLAKAIQE